MPEFGESPVDEFTYPTLYEFSVKLLQSGGSKGTGLSPKTVLDILSLPYYIIFFNMPKISVFLFLLHICQYPLNRTKNKCAFLQ